MPRVRSSVIEVVHTIDEKRVTSIWDIFARPSSTRSLVTVNKVETVVKTTLEFRRFWRCPRKSWVLFRSCGQIFGKWDFWTFWIWRNMINMGLSRVKIDNLLAIRCQQAWTMLSCTLWQGRINVARGPWQIFSATPPSPPPRLWKHKCARPLNVRGS